MLRTYRHDIDGLRAIAALLVLVFHFDLFGIGEAGFVGVDLFFVISGYLITTIVWEQLGRDDFSLATFYRNRIRRLAPALFAVQLGVLVLGAALLLPSEMTGVLKESVAAQAYVSNIYYWRTLNYFGVHATTAFLLHTWSLGVEEQFYLLFPLLLMGVRRWLPRGLGWVLLAVFAVSFALNLGFVHSKPEATFYLLPTRAWELAAGGLLGLVQPRIERAAASLRTALAAGGLALLVVTLVVYRSDTTFPGWFALLPVAAASLLLLAGSGGSNAISRALSWPGLTFFGRISYPLYLVHWPLHIFALTLLPRYTIGWRWALFGLSIVLAWLITRYVERPVRRRVVLRSGGALVRGYGLGLAVFAMIALSGLATHGWRSRYGADLLRVADVADDTDVIGKKWDFVSGQPVARFIRPLGAPGVAPTWVIYGDSHAAALYNAFSAWLAARGEAGELAYKSGCLPLVDTGGAVCRDFAAQMAARGGGKRVLLASIWRQPIEPGYIGRAGTALDRRTATADFQQSMLATVARLRANRSQVYVWEPLPVANFSVPEATARSMVFGDRWPTGHRLAPWRREMAWFYQALDMAAVPVANRYDPAPLICPGGTCDFVRGGVPIYSDTNHPAQHVMPWFAGALEAGFKPPPA